LLFHLDGFVSYINAKIAIFFHLTKRFSNYFLYKSLIHKDLTFAHF